MDRFRRMMAGRYGADQLNMALLALGLLLAALSIILGSLLLKLAALVVLLLTAFRAMSRSLDRRRRENERFLALVVRPYNAGRLRRSDKEHCYFKCPNCGQQLRVPRGKGRIRITCRSCGIDFEEKT